MLTRHWNKQWCAPRAHMSIQKDCSWLQTGKRSSYCTQSGPLHEIADKLKNIKPLRPYWGPDLLLHMIWKAKQKGWTGIPNKLENKLTFSLLGMMDRENWNERRFTEDATNAFAGLSEAYAEKDYDRILRVLSPIQRILFQQWLERLDYGGFTINYQFNEVKQSNIVSSALLFTLPDVPHSIREEDGVIGASWFPKNMHFSPEIEEIVGTPKHIPERLGDLGGELVIWVEFIVDEKLVITKGDVTEFESKQLQPHIWKFHAHFPPGFLVPASNTDIEWKIADMDFSVLYTLTAADLSVSLLTQNLRFGEVWANVVEYSGGAFRRPIAFNQKK